MKNKIFFFILFLSLIFCSLFQTKRDAYLIKSWFPEFQIGDTLKYEFIDSVVHHYLDDTSQVFTLYVFKKNYYERIEDIDKSSNKTAVKMTKWFEDENPDTFYLVCDNEYRIIFFSSNPFYTGLNDIIILKTPVQEENEWNTKGFYNDYTYKINSLYEKVFLGDSIIKKLVHVEGQDEDTFLFEHLYYSDEIGIVKKVLGYKEMSLNFRKYHKQYYIIKL